MIEIYLKNPSAGTPSMKQCNNFKYRARLKDSKLKRITSIIELHNWAHDNKFPCAVTSLDALPHAKMYAIPLNWEAYPNTEAVLLACKSGISWLIQMMESSLNYALHADGKHKVHHGKWILTSVGIHSLEHDENSRFLTRHSFRPLLHYFGKQHESEESMRMILDGLAWLAKHFSQCNFLGLNSPKIGIWDRSAGILAGWNRKFPDHDFATCWPHIMRKVKQGEYMPRSCADHAAFIQNVQVSFQRRAYVC